MSIEAERLVDADIQADVLCVEVQTVAESFECKVRPVEPKQVCEPDVPMQRRDTRILLSRDRPRFECTVDDAAGQVERSQQKPRMRIAGSFLQSRREYPERLGPVREDV